MIRLITLWVAAVILVTVATIEMAPRLHSNMLLSADSGVGGASWTTVSSATGSGLNTFTTTGIDTSTANLIVVSVSYDQAAAGTLTDNKSNTYTLIETALGAGSGCGSRLYYTLPSSVGAGHTWTLTGSGVAAGLVAYALKASGTPALDQHAHVNGGASAATVTLPTVTPAAANEFVATGLCNTASSPPSVAAGFTSAANVPTASGVNYGGSFWSQQQTAATAVGPTWNWTPASGNYAATIATFSPTGVVSSGIALVQRAFSSSGGTNQTSLTATINGVVAGHLLTTMVGWYGDGPTTLTVFDTVNGWFIAAPTQHGGSASAGAGLWYGLVTTGGNLTVTANFTAGTANFPSMYVQEWGGTAASSPLVAGSGAGAVRIGVTSATVTTVAATTQSNQLIVSGQVHSGAPPSGVGGSQLVYPSGGDNNVWSYQLVDPSGSTVTHTYNYGSTEDILLVIAAFGHP